MPRKTVKNPMDPKHQRWREGRKKHERHMIDWSETMAARTKDPACATPYKDAARGYKANLSSFTKREGGEYKKAGYKVSRTVEAAKASKPKAGTPKVIRRKK